MDNPSFHWIERQHIALDAIPTPGWILDLGGGGEGALRPVVRRARGGD